MLDFTKKRDTCLKLKLESGLILELKTLKGNELIKLDEMGKDPTATNLIESVRMMINNNRQFKTFTLEEVAEMFDIEDMIEISKSYRLWLKELSNDPN